LRACNTSSCLEYCERALRVQQTSQEEMEDVLAVIHNTRGALAQEVNDPQEALIQLQETVRLQEAVFARSGKHTRELSASYSELARTFMMNGIFDVVPDLLTKSTQLRQQTEGFNELQLFNPRHQMGLYHLHRLELEAASKYFEDALTTREQAYGLNDTNGTRLVMSTLLLHISCLTPQHRHPAVPAR
jgi:hypothetical protein